MPENAQTEEAQGGSFSPLLILMPLFILLGILIGCFALPKGDTAWLDTLLTVSLFFLYTGAGIILGTNKEVFTYIKKLGLRILFLPLSIFAGCLLGGFLMGSVCRDALATVVGTVSKRYGLLQHERGRF